MQKGEVRVESPDSFFKRGRARDVQVLERFGVVRVTGRQKWVTPVAQEIRLTAVL